VFLVWLLTRIQSILWPFALGFALAYVLNPVVEWMEHRGVRRGRAVSLLFLLLLVVAVFVALLVVPKLVTEARQLAANYSDYFARLENWHQVQQEHLIERLAKWGVRRPRAEQALADLWGRLREAGPVIASYVLRWVTQSVSVLLLLVVVPIAGYWILREYHVLARRLLLFVPERHREVTRHVVGEANDLVARYLLGMLILCGMLSVVATIVLAVFRFQYAYLLGIFVGFAYLIPYVGVPAALLTTFLIGLATGHALGQLAVVLVILIGLNLVTDNLVTPVLVGRRVGLHPLAVVFALLAGGQLFGPVGLIVAVPLAASVKAALVRLFPKLFEPEERPGAATRD
jgi:predicted PurR-regulated permease PerM